MNKHGLTPDSHEIYTRRKTRNVGLGVVLGGTVALIFAVTVVKLSQGIEIQGFDHTYETLPAERSQ